MGQHATTEEWSPEAKAELECLLQLWGGRGRQFPDDALTEDGEKDTVGGNGEASGWLSRLFRGLMGR